MKKSLFLPVALTSLFFAVFAFNACQKETKETLSSSGKGKDDPTQANTKTCVHPIFYNKVVDAYCSDGHSCSSAFIPPTNRNRIKWRVGTQCNNTQNYTGTSYYTLYKYVSPVPGNTSYNLFTSVATFNCTNPNMWYAKTLLTNSSDFILIISDLSTALPSSIHEQNSTGYLYNTGGYFLFTSNYYSDYWRFTTGATAGTVSCVILDPL
jgi:hypothetical protein